MEKLIYFNNAATSFPKAPKLGKVILNHLNSVPLHFGRIGSNLNHDILYECREKIGELLNANPKNIVLT